MPSKRPFSHLRSSPSSSQPPLKKSCRGIILQPGKGYTPQKCFNKHPESGDGDNFHSVPYPLSLLPYDSWYILHHQEKIENRRFRCPKCRKDRTEATAHQRKLFLVAERLSWKDGSVPSTERIANEEQLWEVNFELGIPDPFVEDQERVLGGKRSKANPFYPYDIEEEMEAAFTLIERAERLSNSSFNLWLGLLDSITPPAEQAGALTTTPNQGRAALQAVPHSQTNIRAGSSKTDPFYSTSLLPTPPSSIEQNENLTEPQHDISPSAGVTTQQIESLVATKADKDIVFKILAERVAKGAATSQEEMMFTKVKNDLRRQLQTLNRSQKPTSSCLLVDSRQLPCHASSTALSANSTDSESGKPFPEVVKEQYGDVFKHLPQPVFSRLTEWASQSAFLKELMRKVASKTATGNELANFQKDVNFCYDLWNQQRNALEAECTQALDISTVAGFETVLQRRAGLSGSQRGGVDDAVIHLILEHAKREVLLSRLMDKISSGKSTELQRRIFNDVVEQFEDLFHQSLVPWDTRQSILFRSLAGLKIAAKDALNEDSDYRYHPMIPKVEWTQELADVASRRPRYLHYLKTFADSRWEDHWHLILDTWFPKPGTETAGLPARPPSRAKSSSQGKHMQIPQPSSVAQAIDICSTEAPPRRKFKYRTLSDFYSLLDKIERTSYVGSRYLEAYAEYLNRDACNDCWFDSNLMDDELPLDLEKTDISY